ncbi:hypothetical protein LCGC14_2902460 [marine sediment metagenome]|uniref:Uncharacterized protein n=1 Tax=marine sediment metagenome TaxID=412755 RepID=A0A0F8YFW4_9ZZZZ
MSEARRLLKKAMGYLPSDASVFHQIRAYLAQPSREGELVAALGLFRLGESDHFFGCGLFHKLDKECTSACVAARAALGATSRLVR